jgi:hypothetical protein
MIYASLKARNHYARDRVARYDAKLITCIIGLTIGVTEKDQNNEIAFFCYTFN